MNYLIPKRKWVIIRFTTLHPGSKMVNFAKKPKLNGLMLADFVFFLFLGKSEIIEYENGKK